MGNAFVALSIGEKFNHEICSTIFHYFFPPTYNNDNDPCVDKTMDGFQDPDKRKRKNKSKQKIMRMIEEESNAKILIKTLSQIYKLSSNKEQTLFGCNSA